MKKISIVTPCYNEQDNVEDLSLKVKVIFKKLEKKYRYEHIYIDNDSTDQTQAILREMARRDRNIKVIFNSRNFGHIRSPYHAYLQSSGDAVISIVADFQDPPGLIPDFIKKWEEGYKIVIGVKNKSHENRLMFMIRKTYYTLIKKFSETEQIKNFTGFGLYDRTVIDKLKDFNEPYPYFRGLISEVGFKRAEIDFVQPKRTKGKTKNNFFTLYDMAMTGFVNHTKAPLRIAVFTGLFTGIISFAIGIIYLVYKLVFWDSFVLGSAPVVVGMFFLASVQLFFLGIIGEYIGAIYTQVKNRPHVIERERLNF